MARILFVTGTDTGVGKTVCAAWLLHHLRRSGLRALAMKPLCSGNRADVEALRSAQPGALSEKECNPWFFERALAPGLAAERAGRRVARARVLRSIRALAARCDVLVVEGAGGLMVPAGAGFMIVDLIKALRCDVIVVSRDKLGTINHTLLTLEALKGVNARSVKVLMMERGSERAGGDESVGLNFGYLRRRLGAARVGRMPDLGPKPLGKRAFARHYKKLKKVLAWLAG